MTVATSSVVDGVRDLLDETRRSLRRPMTPGQRQSAMLIVPLTIALIFYGRPAEPGAGLPIVRPAPPSAVSAPADELAEPVPAAEPGPAPAAVPPPAGAPRPGAAAPQPLRTPAEAVPSPPPETEPTIVALVRPDSGAGVGDAQMADAFLKATGLDAALVEHDPDAAVCEEVLARGTLVVAGTGLGPSLRSCLVRGGATVVAYDALGDLAPGVAGPGEVLSTRRGFVAGLVELVRWAVADGRLDGATGLVTVESARDLVDAALPDLERAGVDVAAIAYLPDDGSMLATSEAVLEFVRSGVSTTIFAAPVAAQRAWVDQSSLVSPRMAYLVADSFDAVLDADYPDAFDGARTSTTLRYPWSLAADATRDRCDQTWADASGGIRLSTSERVRLYAWCQHVALASRTGAGGRGADALRQTTLDSPLTTRLGPLGERGWGPTEDLVLTWQAVCTCWVAEGGPADRTTTEKG